MRKYYSYSSQSIGDMGVLIPIIKPSPQPGPFLPKIRYLTLHLEDPVGHTFPESIDPSFQDFLLILNPLKIFYVLLTGYFFWPLCDLCLYLVSLGPLLLLLVKGSRWWRGEVENDSLTMDWIQNSE